MCENKRIFLDSASTTYCTDEVIQSMIPCFSEYFGNPSSTHSFGREADKIVSESREIIASSIGAKSSEIYFTSSGTEANNMAMIGIARANKKKGKHIITSNAEHKSILDSAEFLIKQGYTVTFLNPDKYGNINIEELERSIRPDTILISIMVVNNETGTITNIKEISAVAKSHGIIFHTDAVAGYGIIDIDVNKLGVDSLSLSAQKIYGPKGAGALYVRSGIRIEPIIFGGNQESGFRAGTTNVPCIAGFGTAVKTLFEDIQTYRDKIKHIKTLFLEQFSGKNIIHVVGGQHTADTILSITIDGISNELLQTILDIRGISISLGSACTAGSVKPSHVLLSMGISEKQAKSTIRISFHKGLSDADIIYSTQIISDSIRQLM